MLVPIPGQLAPMAPAPLPTGLTFEGQGKEQGHNQEQGEGQEHDDRQFSQADHHHGQQGAAAGEGNNEGEEEEDYYSFDYPPVIHLKRTRKFR